MDKFHVITGDELTLLGRAKRRLYTGDRMTIDEMRDMAKMLDAIVTGAGSSEITSFQTRKIEDSK